MDTPNDNSHRKSLRQWWMSPPRSGLRLIIHPWEYRHLRGFARVHIVSCIALACLALITLSAGGTDTKTYAFAMVFAAGAAAHLAVGFWELRIIRSQAAGT
jgi:hypothetical protein